MSAVETRREEFGSREIMVRGETAVTAAAAQARSQVEAMYVMALQRPRDMIEVRERLLNECERRAFAEGATYSMPRGGKTITGPSIRFAEAALRSLRNVHVSTTISYEDEERRVGTVTVIDLESNLPYSAGFSIAKTVERRKVNRGDQVLGERVNSAGETVYLIVGTEADVLMKQESLVSRLLRNLALRILPGDIRDEAMAQVAETMRRSDAADPGGAAKRLSDAFHGLGITSTQLRDFLGHAVDRITPDEAQELRGVYAALKDGATTWTEVVEQKRTGDGPSPEERAERAKLLKTIGAAKVKDAKAVEAARKSAGVAKGVQDASLPVETLRAIVSGLTPPAKKTEADEPAGEAGGPSDGEQEAADDLMGQDGGGA